MKQYKSKKRDRIVVDVTFKETQAGGRTSNTPTGRFHCIANIDNVLFDCVLISGQSIAPGETARGVNIFFISDHDVLSKLKIGETFGLQDGNRLIAIAKTVDILRAKPE